MALFFSSHSYQFPLRADPSSPCKISIDLFLSNLSLSFPFSAAPCILASAFNQPSCLTSLSDRDRDRYGIGVTSLSLLRCSLYYRISLRVSLRCPRPIPISTMNRKKLIEMAGSVCTSGNGTMRRCRSDEEVADEYFANHIARSYSITVDVCQVNLDELNYSGKQTQQPVH